MTNKRHKRLISIVIPAYNEAAGINQFFKSLVNVIEKISEYNFEVLFINDGSKDNTLDKLHVLAAENSIIRVLSLSRNFGKEVATTAGINNAKGDALIIMDADGQHPVELIPEYLSKWTEGSNVVIGVRTANQNEGFIKKYGSKLFYKIFNRISGVKLTPGSTDYRLIDKTVQQDFISMTERNRITRGLIDWLGYDRDYIYFVANPRMAGEASYSFNKLVALAVNSIISLSHSPLYIAIYIGIFILPLSALIALLLFIQEIIGDPLGLNVSGSSYVILLILFLIGFILISQGILGLYLSQIHAETQNRPLYIINHKKSRRSQGDENHTI